MTSRLECASPLGNMTETQQTITTWADETFGPCTAKRAVARMIEEMAECQEGVNVTGTWRDECADVLITLYRVASIVGFDLHEAVDAKMHVNRQRLWGVRGDGTGYHL